MKQNKIDIWIKNKANVWRVNSHSPSDLVPGPVENFMVWGALYLHYHWMKSAIAPYSHDVSKKNGLISVPKQSDLTWSNLELTSTV